MSNREESLKPEERQGEHEYLKNRSIMEEDREKMQLIEIKESFNKCNLDNNGMLPLPLMDKLVEELGYTKPHYLIIIFTWLIFFIEGIHVTLISNMFIPIQKYFELQDFMMSLISSLLFLSVGLGSLLTMKTVLIGKRNSTIILYTLLIFVISLLMGIFKNFYLFITLRFILGVCLGAVRPLIFNLLCEYLPIKYRSFFMILSTSSFYLGAIFSNVVMLIIMPNLEPEKIFTVFFIISIPTLIIGIILFLMLEESPRYLIINNHEDEGFIILEKILQKEVSYEERKIIVFQLKENDNNKNVENSFSGIFNYKFRLVTIILIILWMINAYIVYGGSLALSLTLKYIEELNGGKKNLSVNENLQIIKKQILVYVITLPGSLLAAVMTETKFFGRKMTIFSGFLLMGIFNTISVIDVKRFHIYNGISGFFNALSFCGCGTFSSEYYPTKIRDFAVAFLNFTARIAALSSQFIAVWLYKIHYLGMFYSVILVCIIATFITFILPYDTYRKPLDYDYNDDNKDKK
jgi:MFS family permease